MLLLPVLARGWETFVAWTSAAWTWGAWTWDPWTSVGELLSLLDEPPGGMPWVFTV